MKRFLCLFAAFLLVAPQSATAQSMKAYVGKNAPVFQVSGRTLYEVPRVKSSLEALVGKVKAERILMHDMHARTVPVMQLSDPEFGSLYIAGKSNYPLLDNQDILILTGDGTVVGVCFGTTAAPDRVEWFGKGWTFAVDARGNCRSSSKSNLEAAEETITQFRAARAASGKK